MSGGRNTVESFGIAIITGPTRFAPMRIGGITGTTAPVGGRVIRIWPIGTFVMLIGPIIGGDRRPGLW